MNNNKTKVLLCAPSPSNKGGITIWSKTVMDYFSKHDEEVVIQLLPMDRSILLSNLIPKWKRFIIAVKDYSLFFIRLWRILAKDNFSTAHITTIGGWMGSIRDLIFIYICKINGVKAITHYHCGTIPRYIKTNNISWKIQSHVIRLSYTTLVLDESSFKSLQSLGYSNIYKMPNPLPEILKNIAEQTRENNRLLFAGHVVPSKGIFELLEAIKEMNEITLDVLGPHDSNIDVRIKQITDSKAFKAKVVFHGKQNPDIVYNMMQKATLFVLPTYSEGFPMVIMEAMACGCPIISTPVGAIKEMLTTNNDITGYLVPPKNIEILKKTIIYCLSHKTEISEKAKTAKEKVVTMYSTDSVMKQLKKIWET